jgi:hypothetical protein
VHIDPATVVSVAAGGTTVRFVREDNAVSWRMRETRAAVRVQITLK